jgi:hypothetical protein
MTKHYVFHGAGAGRERLPDVSHRQAALRLCDAEGDARGGSPSGGHRRCRPPEAARPRQAEANPAYEPPSPATASTLSRPRAPWDKVMIALIAPPARVAPA